MQCNVNMGEDLSWKDIFMGINVINSTFLFNSARGPAHLHLIGKINGAAYNPEDLIVLYEFY